MIRRLVFCWLVVVITGSTNFLFSQPTTFKIEQGEFLLDGKPFQIISGEMHFARIPREYWRHRLKMLKAMGMNTVATYVFWNYHEKRPGMWDFQSESRDIAAFIRIAQEEGLWVMLRPGPYACAEWEFGGFPWFLQQEKDMVVRNNNPLFLEHSRQYFQQLAKQVGHLQVTKGGSIILVQIENEYGSFGKDMNYKQAIKKQLEEAGFEVPFFTSDGSWLFEGGYVPGVLPTANGEDSVERLRQVVNQYHDGKGPYMVAEFYPGWLDHWAEPFVKVPMEEVTRQMVKYLKEKISFNFYMAHGGTNFGFTSGANYSKEHDIQPDITSYDYDAPISEAGWATPKYKAIRDTLEKYVAYPIPEIPPPVPVMEMPVISLDKAVALFDVKATIAPVVCDTPVSFEGLDQGYGYVLYTRKFTTALKGKLEINGLRDYALLFVNGKRVAELNRYDKNYSCEIDIPADATLDILAENMGRINYGAKMIYNTKGIISAPVINGAELRGGWEMYKMPLEEQPELSKLNNKSIAGHPVFYRGTFQLSDTADTFLDMRSWEKGIVFVNGHHLGRYWNVGPQQTLYLPGCWLKKGENEIVIFEMKNDTVHTQIRSIKTPILEELRK